MEMIWKKIRNTLFRSDGMTMVETLIALVIMAVFAAGITTTVVASNSVSSKADVISHFDRQNQMAISEFKTNPDPEYLKTVKPFSEMDYSEASMSFNKHYDKKFQPTNDSNAPYYVSYQYVTKPNTSGFFGTGEDVVMQIVNQKKSAGGGYEDLQTSAAQGTGQIHTLNATNTSIDPVPPSPTPPSGETSYRVSFVVEGGIFKDEARNKRTVVADKGTPLKNILPAETELQADSSLPSRFTGWKKTGTSEIIPANTTITVTSDMAISGVFEGIPCTVKFQLPYYAGSWSDNPAGEIRNYVSQNGETVDEDGLALLFGRSSYSDLLTGGAVLEGWFDNSGRPFKLGSAGTVLTDDWNGKTVTARVSVPSVAIRINITEGEAAGNYTLTAPIGSTVSESDIAAAAGKDYAKIQNTGRKILSGWKCQDNNVEFVPGSTLMTADWDNKTIVTQYQNAFEPNSDMTLSAEIDDRPYWDITNSTYDFVDSGGTLKLRVKENTTKANTPPYNSDYKYYSLGDINTLKSQITDPGGSLKVKLNVGYKYYAVKKFLQQNSDKKLYFNGRIDQSMTDKFNGQGAAFNLGGAAAESLKGILGFTGNLELKPVFTPREEAIAPSRQILERKKLGAFLELGAVSPTGRKEHEKYKLQLTRSNPAQLNDGTYVYKMGIIGENGDNILDPKKMNPDVFNEDRRTVYPENAGMGSDSLVLGWNGYEDHSNIESIDWLTLIVKDRSGMGAGFRLEFDTEGPQSSADWQQSGSRGYMKRQFDNVKMTSDSVVKVKHLMVYVWNSKDHGRKSVAFENLKPVNENDAYGNSYLGHKFYGGWLEVYMSFANGGVVTYNWPTGDSIAGASGISSGEVYMIDSSSTALPLPDNFEIK